MKMKTPLDIVPLHQEEIHIKLMNWAMWVKPGQSASVCPMFQALGYKSNARQWHQPEYRETCRPLEAQAMEKLVCQLPESNRKAIVWWYVYCSGALKMQRRLGVNAEGLNSLVVNARTMLVNRMK